MKISSGYLSRDTMSKTVDVLFRAVKADNTELTPGTINDYFGYKNMLNGTDLQTIYCVYSDLIKRQCVPKELFENCFFTNRLDELIKQKSKYHNTGYYQQFCTSQIVIGSTYIGESDVVPLPILDDNHCPSCEAAGYVTENKMLSFMSPDCERCGVYMCKECVTDAGICHKCK